MSLACGYAITARMMIDSGAWMIGIAVLGVALLAFVLWTYWRLRTPPTEWHVLPVPRMGERVTMRRKKGGRWEYRPATEAEEADYVSREAW